jgi:hypothetical protein
MTLLNQWSARRRGRYIHNTQQTEETIIRVLIWIKPAIPAIKQLQTYALDRTAAGIGKFS